MIKFPDIFGRRSRAEGRARALFDAAFYLAANPDVARGDID